LRIDPIYLHAGGMWHTIEKLSTRVTNLLKTSSQSEVCTRSYGPPKVAGVPTLVISGLPLGSLGTKYHLDVGLMQTRRVYYKGEGGGFPQVRAVVSLVSPSCPWLVLAPKVLQLCTNHLVLVLYRLVWVSEACQFFQVPSQSSNTPFYPSKVLWTKECASTPCSFVVFYLGLTFEPLKELGAHHKWHISIHDGALKVRMSKQPFFPLLVRTFFS
jgi:hypothetical protein